MGIDTLIYKLQLPDRLIRELADVHFHRYSRRHGA